MTWDARRAAEFAARNSYGRLVAYLVARSGDVTAAEDALGDAFLAALHTWGVTGVPQNPEAWLLVTARRRLIDTVRKTQGYRSVLHQLQGILSGSHQDPDLELTFPDDRLQLLFVCAHPAIDPAIRTPLMLQTVLGLTATQIASAFLIAPATMGQRLVRAKAKIRDAGIRVEVPGSEVLAERLEAVLEAIYAAYTSGWDQGPGVDPRSTGLAQEGLWLARLVVDLLPTAPEARGLLSLILQCESRREARRSATGAYIPLSQQDTQLWSRSLFREAEHHLREAAQQGAMGRFQLEAAIQSLHNQRRITGQVDWPALALLYEGVLQISPSLGAWIGQAAVIAEVEGVERGLDHLSQLPQERVRSYQPYWALQASLLHRSGRFDQAREAYERAIGLTEDPAVRQFLLQQMLHKQMTV